MREMLYNVVVDLAPVHHRYTTVLLHDMQTMEMLLNAVVELSGTPSVHNSVTTQYGNYGNVAECCCGIARYTIGTQQCYHAICKLWKCDVMLL